MPVYKRGAVYWTDFRAANGERIRCSTRTRNKQEAEAFEHKLKAEYYRVQRLGERPRYTWNQAAVKYVSERQGQKSLDDIQYHLRTLSDLLGNIELAKITRDKVLEIREQRMQQKVKNSQDTVSHATVNRMLEVLRSLLRTAAVSWEWIDAAPDVPMLPEDKQRIRFITHDEAQKLIEQLPPHLALMCRFSLATGLREKNVCKLLWSEVSLEARTLTIAAAKMKTKKRIHIPLNKSAIAVLDEADRVCEFVFTYKGKPVEKCNTAAFRKALTRAGIRGFRWHDLRHTWASWHVQNGTPLHVLQELGGWSNFEMVRRYAHLSTEHLAEHVDRICNLSVHSGHIDKTESQN